MKAESTNKNPKFNLLKPDGVRSQAHSEAVTKVLLNDGRWYDIIPGSFKFYRTSSDKAVPFVQFKIDEVDDRLAGLEGHTIEVFPATVAGLAYSTDEDE